MKACKFDGMELETVYADELKREILHCFQCGNEWNLDGSDIAEDF